MSRTRHEQRLERVEKVNQLIRVIGDAGRRFFHHKGAYARAEINDRGAVFWHDEYSGARIYTAYRYAWRGFSHGGTLRDLVVRFRDYIRTGDPINPRVFGPWPTHVCDGDLWGYGADMGKVREAAVTLGIVYRREVEA